VLLVAVVVLVGLGAALASGALRAGKLKPRHSAATVPSLGTAANGVFTGSGVVFDYPTSWHVLHTAAAASGGTPQGRIVLGTGTGSDRVIVEAFRMSGPITDANREGVMSQLGSNVDGFASTQHGTVQEPIATGTLGTLPAFTARAQWPGAGGAEMLGRFYFGYRGYAMYYVNCQRASTAPPAVDAGCDQIVKTFRLS
jgi:hypothetical protein